MYVRKAYLPGTVRSRNFCTVRKAVILSAFFSLDRSLGVRACVRASQLEPGLVLFLGVLLIVVRAWRRVRRSAQRIAQVHLLRNKTSP